MLIVWPALYLCHQPDLKRWLNVQRAPAVIYVNWRWPWERDEHLYPLVDWRKINREQAGR